MTPQRRRTPAAEKPTAEQRVEQSLERLDAAYKELVTGAHFMEAMRFAATQPNYSINNIMLILAQHPTATHVMGYRAWQKEGRQVRKGEKAITIIGGIRRNITVEDERTGEERKEKVFTNRASLRPHRASTAMHVASKIEIHIAGTKLGDRRIATVRPSEVQAWATERSRHLSPLNLRNLVSMVRSIFRDAVLDRRCSENPAARVKLPSYEKPADRAADGR